MSEPESMGVGEEALPEVLGERRVLQRIGEGGMGAVYLAEEEGRLVAIKVIHPRVLERKGFFRRFRREAEAGMRIDHPNVVRTLDVDFVVVEGIPYCVLVMEYVEGQTLREVLEARGPLSEALAREIGRQVADGLVAIHGAGVVHRDLKPENVMITDDQRVRIMDLGVARLEDGGTVLTKAGHFAGSMPYAAPEQFQNGFVGPASDLYAVGVLLYELVTGRNPFRHDEVVAIMHAHLEEEAPRLDAVDPDLTPFLGEVVATLLRKDPVERFEHAAALRDVLAEGEDSEWWAARRPIAQRDQDAVPRLPVRRETRLYGRDADLAWMRERWQAARGGEGCAVYLEGEAGIGKSRLLDTFLDEVRGQDVHVLYGSYAPAGVSEGIRGALLARFGGRDASEQLSRYLSASEALVPGLVALLRHAEPPSGTPPLAPSVLAALLAQLLSALAREKPLVWIVEDLHNATVDSLRLVTALVRATVERRVLFVATSRPVPAGGSLMRFLRPGELESRRLGRLSPREVVLLLADAFRSGRLAEKLGGTIALKSDGIPFFIFEMIRGLREGQFLSRLADGSWIESREIEEIEVPSAVRDLIELRLSDLERDDRAILDAASVEGYEFNPAILAEVLDRKRLTVLQALADIERRSGVVRAQGSKYRFDHHQIQELIYEDLPPPLRAQYHVLIGDALHGVSTRAADGGGLDIVRVCEHFFKGDRPDLALPLLDRALENLDREHWNERAAALARKALGVDGMLTGSRRAELLLRQVLRLDILGEREEQARIVEEVRALAESIDDPTVLLRAEGWTGSILHAQSRLDEAEVHFQREADIAREIGHKRGEAKAHSGLGAVALHRGEYPEAERHFTRCARLGEETGHEKTIADALGGLGTVCYYVDRREEAARHYDRQLEISRRIGDRRGEVKALAGLGVIALTQADVSSALEHFDAAITLAQRIGDREDELVCVGNLALIQRRIGRYRDAEELGERYLELSRQLGVPRYVVGAMGQLAYSDLRLGRLSRARERFEAWQEMAQELGDRASVYSSLTGQAHLALEDGDTEGARTRHEEALALARRLGMRAETGQCLAALARLALDAGDEGRARDLLDEAHVIAEETQDVSTRLRVAVGRARLDPARAPEARALVVREAEKASVQVRMDIHFQLWQVTGDVRDLTEARTLMRLLRAHAPDDAQECMVRNVRLHRAIVSAKEARSR